MDENKETFVNSAEDSQISETELQEATVSTEDPKAVEPEKETQERLQKDPAQDASSVETAHEVETQEGVIMTEEVENAQTEAADKREPIERIFTDDAPQNAYPVKFVERSSGAMVNLILSVLGLLLSILVFPGIVLSLIGMIGSIKGLKVKDSQINKWGFWVGLVATFVNLFMIVSFIIFVAA